MNVHPRLDTTTVSQATYHAYTGKDYAAEKMTAKALQFMQQHRQQPFFLYLAYPQPHASLQVPEEYVSRYKGRFSEQPYKGQQGYTPVQYPASTHAAMISYLDDQVGIIMQKLAALGLDGNTLVFFSSDNGPSSEGGVDPAFFNSSGGLRGGKRDLFEGGIRVPFIARWKGRIPAGTESHLASAQYDMPATLADLTGQRIPGTDGITLLPELLRYRGMAPRHEYFYFEFPEKGGQLAVIKGNMKGVKLDLRQHPDNPWMIFDLSKDPGEQHNIAAQHPDLVKEFNAIVQKEHRHPHIREWEFVDPKMTGKAGD
jgi:arylsulfatase A-like enzyme